MKLYKSLFVALLALVRLEEHYEFLHLHLLKTIQHQRQFSTSTSSAMLLATYLRS